MKPKLVAEVRFAEWTAAGEMRHPVFLGLRTDKKATEVTRETPKPLREERSPHPASPAVDRQGGPRGSSAAMRAVRSAGLSQVVAKYGIAQGQAQREVDAVLKGRQIGAGA